MNKFDLGKTTSALNEKMNKKSNYVNEKKCDMVVKDIEKQLDNLSKSLNKINVLMNKCLYKKTVKNEDAELFVGWSKKCVNQANSLGALKKEFRYMYNDSVKNYTIKLLDERIAILERKISNIEK